MIVLETHAVRSVTSSFQDEFVEETLWERLVGLTEMFPEPVCNFVSGAFSKSLSLTKASYGLSRTISWVVFSSAAIVFFPLAIELERAQQEEQEAQQHRQMMLGPQAAGLPGFSAANSPFAVQRS